MQLGSKGKQSILLVQRRPKETGRGQLSGNHERLSTPTRCFLCVHTHPPTPTQVPGTLADTYMYSMHTQVPTCRYLCTHNHTTLLLHMKIQKGLSSKSNPNLGEAIPMPSQAHLHNIYQCKRQSHFRCLSLKSRTGRTYATPTHSHTHQHYHIDHTEIFFFC